MKLQELTESKETWTRYLELLNVDKNKFKKEDPHRYKFYATAYKKAANVDEFEQNWHEKMRDDIKSIRLESVDNDDLIRKVKRVINDGSFYDRNGKKKKGTTFVDVKYGLNMEYGIKRIPSAVAFQRALSDAGLNIDVTSGTRKENGKGKVLGFWVIK